MQHPAGLEKYLNSSLPFGQVTLKYYMYLPRALSHLPKFQFMNQKWKLFIGVFECYNLSDLLVIFSVSFDQFYLLIPVLRAEYLNPFTNKGSPFDK